MRLLLDTHAWLWAIDPNTGTLRTDVREAIEEGSNDVFLSAASAWELAIKFAHGKIDLPAPPEEFVPEHVERASMTWLPITPAHALRVAALPRHHSDPFDRLLVAQALMEDLIVVTADRHFRRYGVQVLRA